MTFIGSEVKDCPVADAKPGKGKYYRLLKDRRLVEKNFWSRARLGIGDKNICEEHAVSLKRTLAQAKQMRKLFPKPFGKAAIAEVSIDTNHGVIHHDKVDHANWWHPENMNPLTIASLLQEEE